jgi:hypothetical protein
MPGRENREWFDSQSCLCSYGPKCGKILYCSTHKSASPWLYVGERMCVRLNPLTDEIEASRITE